MTPPPDATHARWRTGRHVGRTIYAQPGPEAAGTDPLIGVMDTPALAAAAVDAHNAALDPPRRDPASTTTMTTDRAWTGARRAPASGFGFGLDVTG